MSGDLTPEALRAALRGRPFRSYPAVVSTGSVAHWWASAGAPGGAVVIAGEQVSPRGHAGRPVKVPAGVGVGLSLVMRPSLAAIREGWLYTMVLTAIADALGGGATVEWPGEVCVGDAVAAFVGIHTRVEEEDDERLRWAIVDVVLPDAPPPRAPVVAAAVDAIEARAAAATGALLRDYHAVCQTIGRRVRVRMRAGTGRTVEGRAIETLEDGALVLETRDGSKGPVRPQDVRWLERL